MKRMNWLRAMAVLVVCCGTIRADAPSGYYNGTEELGGEALRQELHDIIDGHTQIPYSASTYDVRDACEDLDEDQTNTNNVITIYAGTSMPKSTFPSWNREHTWPQSMGATGAAKSDCHHLFASDAQVNGIRGHLYFDNGGSPVPGAPFAKVDGNSFEPPDERKGDVARALFYMDVRYDGSDGAPDMELTDNTSLITLSNGRYMGKLSVLLAWHQQDPVDGAEMARNDFIYENIQGNRNPFVDHPEWVSAVFGGDTGGGDTGGGDTGGGDTGGSDTGGSAGTLTLTSGVSRSDSVAKGAWDHFKITVPSGATSLSVIMTGNNDADLYVRKGSQPTSGSWDYRPYVGGSNETVTVSAPAATTWYISVYGYSSSTSSYSLKATVTAGSTGGGSTGGGSTTTDTETLAGNVNVAQGAWKHYNVTVPSGASKLVVQLSGSGDGDLYVKKGSQPSTSSYDHRPYLNGSNETVTIDNPGAGIYYLSVRGYTAATVTLKATLTGGQFGGSGGSTETGTDGGSTGSTFSPTTLLSVNGSVNQGSWKNYTIQVPSGATKVTIAMTGSGDGDLYVRKGTTYATLSTYDFRPYLNGTNETVVIDGSTSPALSTGQWYVSAHGYTSANFAITATAE